MAVKKKNTGTSSRTVRVDLGRPLSGDEIRAAESLTGMVSPGEIRISILPTGLQADLIHLDPGQIHGLIGEILGKDMQAVPDDTRDVQLHPLMQLYDEILKVRSYGIRNGKRLYAGYADERKVGGRKEKEKARGAYYYAKNHSFSKIRNSLPETCTNQIIAGDSETVLASLPDNCIDLIITSPPYNFGIDYLATEDGINWSAYLEKLFRIFREGIRVLTYGGRFIVNIQPLFSDYIPLHHLISSFFMNEKMIWKGEIIWEKNNYNCKYTAWGSWKSPSSPYLKYTWEFIEVFCKGDLKKDGRGEDADILDEEFKSWVVAKWSIGPERRMKQYNHPAMFPEELVERCLKLFSFKGDIILDPFSGVGTTALVASRLGRRYLGIDISDAYCEAAKGRISKEKPGNHGYDAIIGGDADSSPSPQQAPKKRGRPRKDSSLPLPVPSVGVPGEKRGRGRPKKSVSAESGGAVSVVSESPVPSGGVPGEKRGRGRPKKSVSAESGGVVSVASESPVPSGGVPGEKRGRGRPKKSVSAESGGVVSVASESPVPSGGVPGEKRKRGRPKKSVSAESGGAVSVASESPVPSGGVPGEKRKRGRPRKTDSHPS